MNKGELYNIRTERQYYSESKIEGQAILIQHLKEAKATLDQLWLVQFVGNRDQVERWVQPSDLIQDTKQDMGEE